MKSLYIILDVVAEQQVGEVVSVAHERAAIRDFHDLLADKRTSLSRHPGDYQLVYVGTMNLVGQIVPDYRIAATGASWLEYQTKSAENPPTGEVQA